MAYMGRDCSPSLGGGHGAKNNNRNNNKERIHYRSGLYGTHYYIPLDNTYVLLQMIATIIIFATAGIAFLITYKPSIDIKKVILVSDKQLNEDNPYEYEHFCFYRKEN